MPNVLSSLKYVFHEYAREGLSAPCPVSKCLYSLLCQMSQFRMLSPKLRKATRMRQVRLHVHGLLPAKSISENVKFMVLPRAVLYLLPSLATAGVQYPNYFEV